MIAPARRLDQLDQRPRERRLAAARLADEPERLAGTQRRGRRRRRRGSAPTGAPEQTPDLIGKCLTRSSTRRISCRRVPRGVSAGCRLGGSSRRRPRVSTATTASSASSSAKWHAEQVVGSSRSLAAAASPSRQRARPCERKQRGWNGHPGGTADQARRLARDRSEPVLRHRSSAAGCPSARSCTGGAARRRSCARRVASTMWPAYMTSTRSASSGDEAEVVRDQDRRGVGVSSCAFFSDLEDLRLDRDVERRRRLVGDQHVGPVRDRHRDHRALAHAARELVRVLPVARCRGSGRRRVGAARSTRRSTSRPSRCADRAISIASAIWSPTVSTGFSDVIGSWKTIAISLPRDPRAAPSATSSRGRCPRKIASPRDDRPGGCGISPSIDSADTLLPEPDSPTTPSDLARVDVVA